MQKCKHPRTSALRPRSHRSRQRDSSLFCVEWWQLGTPEEIRTPAPRIRSLGRTIEIIEVCYHRAPLRWIQMTAPFIGTCFRQSQQSGPPRHRMPCESCAVSAPVLTQSPVRPSLGDARLGRDMLNARKASAASIEPGRYFADTPRRS